MTAKGWYVLKAVHYALLVLTIAVIVTGLGISYYRTVTRLTFGLLDKAFAFKLHL